MRSVNGTRLEFDAERVRSEILDPSRTVSVIRRAVDPATLEAYLDGVFEAFEHGERTKEKPTVDEGPDRVLPWLYDHERGRFMVHRLYRFVHNEAGTVHGGVHASIMAARDEVERVWPNEGLYAERGLRSVHLITKYEHGADGYPRHTDVPFEWGYPLLQCWLQLTEPGVDFVGGDLRLFPPGGGVLSVTDDLHVRAGDVLLFDKRTEHEVTPCGEVAHGRGRIISIVGAMAPMAVRAAA